MPRGKWREKYECRPGKGEHKFMLVKPKFHHVTNDPKLNAMGVKAYYNWAEADSIKRQKETERREREMGAYRGFFSRHEVWYEFECVNCMKREYEIGGRMNKKIKIRLLP